MSSTTLLWLAGALLTVGIAALAFSRPFRVERLSIFGVEASLHPPIEWKGHRWLTIVAAALLIGAIASGAMAAKSTLLAPSWPTTFDEVQTAELQLSDIDDFVDVSINGQHLAHAEWGQTPPWVSIKKGLRRGPNSFEIWITNDKYGGCGGTVTLRLNGLTDPAYSWTWRETQVQEPGVTCFRSIKTLNLE